MEIHSSTEDSGELLLEVEEREPRCMAGIELYQHVDVALGSEVVSKYRAEEREPADVMLATEGLDPAPVDRDLRDHQASQRVYLP